MISFPLYLITICLFLLSIYIYIPALADKTFEVAPVVLDLNGDDFKPFIDQNQPTFVMFYSPSCGHCQKMKPEYEKLGGVLKKNGVKVHVTRIDGSGNKKIIAEQKIEGYPTIKLYNQDKIFDYRGERSSQAMAKWLKKMTGTAVTLITDEKNVEADSDEGFFIGYFTSKSSPLYEQYNNIASKNRQLSTFFAVIPSPKNSIIAVKEDEDKIEYEGNNEKDLLDFIQTQAYPKLAIVNPGNFEKFLARNLPFAWFEGTTLDYERYSDSIRKAAVQFKNEFSFVWVDSYLYSPKDRDNLAPSFMLNLLNGTRYEMDNSLDNIKNPDEVVKFLNDAKNGKIPPFLKSDPIPETNEGPVTVVVGKNLMDTAFQYNKDVMIEVYAPWCGHCKKLESVYTEVAKHFKRNPNVLISKMDGTTNESPSDKFAWKGFPTIFFIKAGYETPIQYEGERSKEAIIDFIVQNGVYGSYSPFTSDEL